MLGVNHLAQRSSSTIKRWRWNMSIIVSVPHCDHSHRDEIIWNPQFLSEKVGSERACQIGRQALVNDGKKDEQRSTASVKVPVGYRPFNLSAVRADLVRLMIPIMIELLTNTRHHQHRSVSPEPVQFSNSSDPLRLSYDDKGHALAETSAWIVLRQFNYTTDLFLWNRQWFERSDHPPLPNHPFEFHATAHRGTLLKRML